MELQPTLFYGCTSAYPHCQLHYFISNINCKAVICLTGLVCSIVFANTCLAVAKPVCFHSSPAFDFWLFMSANKNTNCKHSITIWTRLQYKRTRIGAVLWCVCRRFSTQFPSRSLSPCWGRPTKNIFISHWWRKKIKFLSMTLVAPSIATGSINITIINGY